MTSASGPKAGKEPSRWEVWALLGVCVLGGSILAAPPAAAQGEEAAPWTLSRLVQHALRNNKSLAASRLATNVAEEDVEIAKGRRLPSLDAVSNFQHFPIRSRLLLERHGRRPGNPFQESIITYGLRATLPLYTGGRLQREIAISEAAVAASRSRTELTRQELIFNVTSAFYTYLLVREVIAANEALVRSVEESRRAAAERVKFGRAAPIVVCEPAMIDKLVTDAPPPADLCAAMAAWSLEIIVAGNDAAGAAKG